MYKSLTQQKHLGVLILVFACIGLPMGLLSLFYTFEAFSQPFSATGYTAVYLAVYLAVILPFSIVSTVFGCIWHYKNWAFVDPDLRKTSPGKAVGFSFIPFFNFYWVFVTLIGLWDGLNEMKKRYPQEDSVSLPRGIPIAIAVCILVSMIPVLNIATSLASWILALIFIIRTNRFITSMFTLVKPAGAEITE
ncbi:MAG: DUF4328 domain-containing protein [Spirochaetales bacterium]|nr:DUF4328 domain-containing protein [Spirochaetales bacterium]MCF7937823.1 DUF4328 domain-containing protein [Spirochaetales bacterium]